MKKLCYVFDLDGTLAANNGRDFYNPKQEDILTDSPIIPVINILNALYQTPASDIDIIFLSSREAKFFSVTKQWIWENTSVNADDIVLWMRKTGDQRKDSIIKKELVESKILPEYDIIGVFDDRLQVCRMWYDMNIFCFNVNQHLIEF